MQWNFPLERRIKANENPPLCTLHHSHAVSVVNACRERGGQEVRVVDGRSSPADNCGKGIKALLVCTYAGLRNRGYNQEKEIKMTRRELIRRIKAGAPAYAPIGVKNGKDWVYAELDTKALLLDVKLDPGMNKF